MPQMADHRRPRPRRVTLAQRGDDLSVLALISGTALRRHAALLELAPLGLPAKYRDPFIDADKEKIMRRGHDGLVKGIIVLLERLDRQRCLGLREMPFD